MENHLSLTEKAGLAAISLLFFVWPIPHTVSLRDLLLVLSLVLFISLAWRKRWPGETLRDLRLPVGILAALTLWMYVVAIFISAETAWSLDEIQSQWWRALAALTVGALVALASQGDPSFKQKILVILLAVLTLHIAYVDLQAVQGWLGFGSSKRIAGLTDGPDKSNYLTNLLFCFLLAELFYRARYRKPVLPIRHAVLAALLVLAAISEYAESTRNGIITLTLMVLVLSVLYLDTHRGRLKKSILAIGVGIVLLVAFGGSAWVMSARQSSSLSALIETVPLAWDTQRYKAWQDEHRHPLPKLSNGEPVETSAYQRIAWFKEGLMLVREHPLGIGYGRNAYGHGIQAKYGVPVGHSHSGLLDLAIGIGIPGVLFALALFASLMSLAYRRLQTAPNYAAVLLLLVVLDYSARLLLDSIQRDHMLQQFMFLAGLAAVMTMTETATAAREKPRPSYG